MRVKATTYIINGSGYPEMANISCEDGDIFDMPEHRALEAQKHGVVIIIEPKPEPIETAAYPGPPRERALSQRGMRGRFTKAEATIPPSPPLPPAKVPDDEPHDGDL